MTIENTGTQTATINTEHTLVTSTVAKPHVAEIDLRNMAASDVVEIRVYVKVKSADAHEYLAYKATFSNAQGDGAGPGSSANTAVVTITDPIPSGYSLKVTLKQTAGTGRSFDWTLFSI